MRLHIDTTVIDGFRLYDFYKNIVTNCNYPEANLTSTIYINNIKYFFSSKVLGGHSPVLFHTSSPGNVTVLNIDEGNAYSVPADVVAFAEFFISKTWLPDDDLDQVVHWENITNQGFYESSEKKYLLNAFMSLATPYRKTIYQFYNFEFKNSDIEVDYPFISQLPDPLWVFDLRNVVFQNSSTTFIFIKVQYLGDIRAENVTFKDISTAQAGIIFNFNKKVELK